MRNFYAKENFGKRCNIKDAYRQRIFPDIDKEKKINTSFIDFNSIKLQ